MTIETLKFYGSSRQPFLLAATKSAKETNADQDQPAHPCGHVMVCTVRYSAIIFYFF
jgi:hypothetical protein